jgi:predicted outer membrane repeat protein
VVEAVPAFVARAGTFTVACGDVSGLITAINAANASPGPSTINLSGCTYTLTTAAATTDGTGADGLPVITGMLTIDGNGATIARDSSAAPFRIVHVAGGAMVTVSGLTISGGDSSGLGGGILNDGRLTIEGSGVLDNAADGGGGGIGNHPGAALTIDTSAVSGNSAPASNDGGGIASGGMLTIANSDVSGNSVPAPSAGGAIESFGTLDITHTQFSDNTAGVAGAILDQSSMTASRTHFAANSATTDQGGALYVVSGASADVTDSGIDGNQAVGDGGGVFLETGATLMLTSSGVHGNASQSGGGGLFDSAGALVTLQDTIVTGNQPDNCEPSGTIAACAG